MVGLNKEGAGSTGYRTGDEPDGDDDEERGAQVGREDLALRQLQRHEARQLQLRRRIGVPHCRRRRRLLLREGTTAVASRGREGEVALVWLLHERRTRRGLPFIIK